MKKTIIRFIMPLLFILTGLFVGIVPVVLPMVHQAEHNAEIEKYNEKISSLTEEERKEAVDEMKSYNHAGQSNYYTALDNDTVISYIDIPNINVYLPIFKGTDEDTLNRGIGIMENTSLLVGGLGSHCVLSGHSGLTTRTMFNSLEQLEIGDCFYLHTYGYTLSYKIVSIRAVLPGDVLAHIGKDEKRDLCTLLTCTPQGVNTHRLLVTGERTSEPTVVSRRQGTTEPAIEKTTAAPVTETTQAVAWEKPKQVFPFTAVMLLCSVVSVLLEVLGVACLIRLGFAIRKKDGDS